LSDYRTLTNRAIKESGADLDEIQLADWTSPTDSMQRKFQYWIQSAWREIQMESNDWHWMSKQAQLILRPRLLVVDGDRSVAPPATSTFEGDDTGATFEVVDTVLLSGTWAAGTAVALIEYTDLDGEFKWNELYDETAPTPANTDVFRLKWWGRYNLATEISDLAQADYTTFYVQSTGGSADQTNTATPDNKPLVYVPWADWLPRFEGDQISRACPQYFTMTPDGWIDFWPRMDQEYVLSFTYAGEPQELSAAVDTPTGLDTQYQDIIVWRAVMKWADFQERPAQFARAERWYETYKNRMEKNKKPNYSFAQNPFNYDGWGWGRR
jgi:hypothetical protein